MTLSFALIRISIEGEWRAIIECFFDSQGVRIAKPTESVANLRGGWNIPGSIVVIIIRLRRGRRRRSKRERILEIIRIIYRSHKTSLLAYLQVVTTFVPFWVQMQSLFSSIG